MWIFFSYFMIFFLLLEVLYQNCEGKKIDGACVGK